MMTPFFYLILNSTILCLMMSCTASRGMYKHDLVAKNHLFIEGNNIYDETENIMKLLRIRGGTDQKVDHDIFSTIKQKINKLLRFIVPRSFWPKSWKSKSSKMMSKEHLEKSFSKGDSNSRVQKVLK